ncbi:macro domain-containing protein [Escherichia coli]
MITLILSAPVTEMAEAFKQVFANADSVNIVGKPFETIREFDCMVSAANSFGLMDGGVDAAITAFFGTQLQSRVQNHILREYLGEQPVGSAFVIETGHNHHPWLVHAPTMRVPLTIDGTDAVYNATWAALLAIFQHNKNATTDMKIKTVVFPAMGAGCGQVPFESVARQMKQAWDNFNKKTESINWEYAQSRQSAVFGTYAYCPGNSVCRYADTKYIGCGDYRTCCSRSGQICINPEHQADDVLIQHQANNRFRPGSHIHRINPENPVGNVTSGAHSHGSSIVIGTPIHTLNKQYSVSDIK